MKEDLFENQSVRGRMALKLILRNSWEPVDWVHLDWWDSVMWQILRNGNKPSVSLEWSHDHESMI